MQPKFAPRAQVDDALSLIPGGSSALPLEVERFALGEDRDAAVGNSRDRRRNGSEIPAEFPAPQGLFEDVLRQRVAAAADKLDALTRYAEAEDLLGPMKATLLEAERNLARLSGALKQTSRPTTPKPERHLPGTVFFELALPEDQERGRPRREETRDRQWARRFEPKDFEPGDLIVEPVEQAPDPALWRGRLEIDPEVSELTPVIRGTWVTVDHVVSLVVDGWSWARITEVHPDLSTDDIRACMAFATEEESGAGYSSMRGF